MIQIASKEEILDAVEAALNELTNEFIRNPMRFFSEKDFHWYFCCLLNMNELVKTQFNGHKTMIVHQEYGTVEMKGKMIDVVVLDPEDVKGINGWDLKQDKQFLYPLVAIEFGTEKKSTLLEDINNEYYRKLESLGARTKKKCIAIYYRELANKEDPRYLNHLKKMDAIKEEVKKASKKPGLEVIGIVRYVYDNKYEKYEDGEWKTYHV